MTIQDIKFQAPIPLVQKLVGNLTDAILDGTVNPGEQLKEISLSRHFGVSRFAIREAFRILEEKDLITSIPRKGCFVRDVRAKDIQDLVPVRALLEGFAAQLAVSNLTDNDFGGLESSIKGMVIAAQNDDLPSFLKDHYEFHRIYINASNNNTLKRILEPMLNQDFWYRRVLHVARQPFRFSIENHKSILRAFREGKSKKVRFLVEEHIIKAMEPFMKKKPGLK
jgi:DNA-binding GntR family transcriptional regulator